MCGIVGMVGTRDVTPVLLDGLRRLEYRGYDSAGLAVVNGQELGRVRRLGKVQGLEDALEQDKLSGFLGIAHTRWATHGAPSELNAHPHTSGNASSDVSADVVAVVHNGIVENHAALREELEAAGFEFTSETDSEVIAHRIRYHLASDDDLQLAVSRTAGELEGGYASIVAISARDPDALFTARAGTPVVVGLGDGENFVASDVAALLPVTKRFQFLEEGDVAVVRRDSVKIFDSEGREVERPIRESELTADAAELGRHRHYMEKEIHEQPAAIASALEGRISAGSVPDSIFGEAAEEILSKVGCVHIVACGTSYHAGLVARYQLEEVARIPCTVDIASEYRYRSPVVPENTLFIAISQSGETAGRLAGRERAGLPGDAGDLQRR